MNYDSDAGANFRLRAPHKEIKPEVGMEKKESCFNLLKDIQIYIHIYLKTLPQVITVNSLKQQNQGSSSRHLGTNLFSKCTGFK